MTPGIALTDLKVIYGDGILGGGGLLKVLGITKTCRIVLDHQHLLSDDIGAWPKKFGQAWARLKKDFRDLVKTYEVAEYK
jgi:hypothetical protein